MTDQSPPPGWYPSARPGEFRWWDGQQWTDHSRVSETQHAQVEGATVSTAADKRIKRLGVHWGLGPPVVNIVLGIIMILQTLGVLGLTLLFPQTPKPGEAATDAILTLLWIAMLGLFILIGTIAIINGYFGLKIARIRREGNPQPLSPRQ